MNRLFALVRERRRPITLYLAGIVVAEAGVFYFFRPNYIETTAVVVLGVLAITTYFANVFGQH